jgi:hypothetical protein
LPYKEEGSITWAVIHLSTKNKSISSAICNSPKNCSSNLVVCAKIKKIKNQLNFFSILDNNPFWCMLKGLWNSPGLD